MSGRVHEKAIVAGARLAPISRSAPIPDAIRGLLVAGKPSGTILPARQGMTAAPQDG